MSRQTILFTLLVAGSPLAAQSQTSNSAVVNVELSNFQFSPKEIHLKAGVPIVLRLHNAAGGGHNFNAPQFFRAAKMSPTAIQLVHDGIVEIHAHGTVDIALTPSAGSYRLKCSHTLHSTFGMKGAIRVG